MVQLIHPYITTGKTIALTRWTFVGKVMSLVFNTMSRFLIDFIFFSFFFKFTYLFVPGLSCGMRDLVPCSGIEPRHPALGARSLSH